MKKLAVLLTAAIMCVSLVACGKETPQEIVSRELGVDVSGGTEISYEDTRSEERRVGKECRSRWSPYH